MQRLDTRRYDFTLFRLYQYAIDAIALLCQVTGYSVRLYLLRGVKLIDIRMVLYSLYA